MAIDPSELNPEALEALSELAEKGEKKGKDLTTTLREAVNAYLDQRGEENEDDWLDTEYIKWCEEQRSGKQPISLAEVRQALSTIEGSLSDAIIAERDEP